MITGGTLSHCSRNRIKMSLNDKKSIKTHKIDTIRVLHTYAHKKLL